MQGGTAEIKQLRQVGVMARRLSQAIGGQEAGLAGRTSLETGVGRDRLARDLPHRRDRRAASRANRRAARICTTASRNASTCSRATARRIAESGEIPIKPGDIVLIPPNEKHMTRNTGTEPLVLLCFFAEPDVVGGRNHRVQELLKHLP